MQKHNTDLTTIMSENKKQPEKIISVNPLPRKGKRPRLVKNFEGQIYEKVLKTSGKK